MPEPNGALGSTPSEIRLNADHAGLSVPLKLSLTDLPLILKERSTLSCLLNGLFLATLPTTDAEVDTFPTHGNS